MPFTKLLSRPQAPWRTMLVLALSTLATLASLASFPQLAGAQQPLTDLYQGPYRSPANPHYWQNRPHDSSYWQQDVAYTIRAALDDTLDAVRGQLTVTYWNNSPDTLADLWFHLYQNAFLPGSPYHELQEHSGEDVRHAHNEALGRGTDVEAVRQDGTPVLPLVDHSRMRLPLARPLLPGDSTTIDLNFTTWFADPSGSQRRRMKYTPVRVLGPNDSLYTVKHYNLVLWYPRVAVYDPKVRWHTPQHMRREFYGNFGSYDVALTLPAHYIADGTGQLQNEDEVLPTDLQAALDLRNFKDKPFNSPAKELLPPTTATKTWRYQAVNTHDAAYTFGPTYRRQVIEWQGVDVVALAREEHASGWQDAAPFARDVLEVYSRDFGAYGWPKIIVADADDGMEYPMLTLDGGRTPGYKDLLAHEIGHMWFYGMLGSNETYRALMDEGFTQFLTLWAMEKLVDSTHNPATGLSPNAQSEVYLPYLFWARNGLDGRLAKHSHDHCHGYDQDYGQVYFKTAMMLEQLRLAVGDQAFLKAMRHYVAQWRYRHPYPEHMTRALTDALEVDLTWLFDDWLNSTKRLDVGIAALRTRNQGKTLELKLKRHLDLTMPLDLWVFTDNPAGGLDTLKYQIPNTPTLPAKPGFKPLQPWVMEHTATNRTYTTTLDLPTRYRGVAIDPTRRLADLYPLNNSRGQGVQRVKWSFFAKPQQLGRDAEHYRLNITPNLWWNGQAGFLPGATIRGGFGGFGRPGEQHALHLKLWVGTNLGTTPHHDPAFAVFDGQLDRLNMELGYRTTFVRRAPNMGVESTLGYRDGLWYGKVTLGKHYRRGNPFAEPYQQWFVNYTYLYRDSFPEAAYLLYPDWWTLRSGNASLNLGYLRRYGYGTGSGSVSVKARAAAVGSDRFYGWLRLENLHTHNLVRDRLKLKTRVFLQYGDGDMPQESQLYLAQGSPEEMMEHDAYRARGYFPDAMLANGNGALPNNVAFGGGLGLRGYTGYLAEIDAQTPSYRGTSGASLNAELEVDNLMPRRWRRYVNLAGYAFGDVGVLGVREDAIGPDAITWDQLRADAGLGLALTATHPTLDRSWRRTTLRFDVPLFLSTPPFGQDYVAWRWLIGVGRAF